MKNIFNILIFSVIINITQAQGNIEILKQIVQSADLFQDFPIIKFIDTNKNLTIDSFVEELIIKLKK